MRLENKEEYEGRFWFPKLINRIGNGKGQKIGEIYPSLQEIAGHLTIETDGSVSLSLNFPSWDAGFKFLDRLGDSRFHDFSRIHGIVNKKFVILLGCKENGHSFVIRTLGMNTKTYSSLFCIIRNQFSPLLKEDLIKAVTSKEAKQTLKKEYPEIEDFNDSAKIDFNDTTDIKFDTLYFHFDRLDSFFRGMTGFGDLSNDAYDKLVSRTSAKIEWKKQTLNIHCGNDFALRVENEIDYFNSPMIGKTERTIKEYVRCVLEFPDPLPLKKCVRKIEQIKSFFEFVFGRRIGITHLSGSLQEKVFSQLGNKGKIYKQSVRHAIHYQHNHWDAVHPPSTGDVPGIYKSYFVASNGNQLFGKYISCYMAKAESDPWFDDVFHSHLLSLSPLPMSDQFTRRIQNFEYLFQEYMVSRKGKNKNIENIAVKIKILLNEANFPYEDDLTKQIRSLSKSDTSCGNAELYSNIIKDMRNLIVHPKTKRRQIDYGLMRDLWHWLNKIERFYLLSIIYENNSLNKKIANSP